MMKDASGDNQVLPETEGIEFGPDYISVPKSHFELVYESWILDVYRPLGLKSGDTVLDLGANVGDFTIRAARTVGDTGLVIAVEPNPIWFKLLERNVLRNNLRNVRLLNCAVGECQGTVVLSQDRVLRQILPSVPDRYSVSSLTLDDICTSVEKTGRLLAKIDIEGYEGEALSNQSSVSRFDGIIMEVHGKQQEETVSRILDARNLHWSRIRVRSMLGGLTSNIICRWPWIMAIELRSRFLGLRRFAEMAVRGRPLVIDQVEGGNLEIIHAWRNGSSSARSDSQ